MMKNVKGFVLRAMFISLCVFASTVKGQSGKLKMDPEKPMLGEMVTITFDPSGSILENAGKITMGTYTVLKSGNDMATLETQALEMKLEGKIWKVSLRIKDSTIITALKFIGDEGVVNNKENKGFLIKTYDKSGAETIDSKIGYYLIQCSYGYYLGFDFDQKQIYNEILELKELFDQYPEYKRTYFNTIYSSVLVRFKINDKQFTVGEIEKMLSYNNFNEEDYCSLHSLILVGGITEEYQKYEDIIKNEALSKYPNGKLAYRLASLQIRNDHIFIKEIDSKERIRIFESLKKNKDNIEYAFNVSLLFSALIRDNEFALAKKISNSELFPLLFRNSYKNLSDRYYSWVLSTIPGTVNEIHKVIEHFNEDEVMYVVNNGLKILRSEYYHPTGSKPSEYLPDEWQQKRKEYLIDILGQYAEILIAFNKKQEAIKIYDEMFALKPLEQQSLAIMYPYLNLLDELKFNEKADLWRKKIAQNSLKPQLEENKAPEFSLKDDNGNLVSLADLKGKVVVLDFWATWCGPCKMSFPDMQKLVEKYKNDKEVVFLFIDTRETLKPEEANALAIKYIKDNNFDFKVLFDNDNTAYDNYGGGGIPKKVIIDKKGYIRLIKTGFNSNFIEMINEFDGVISILK